LGRKKGDQRSPFFICQIRSRVWLAAVDSQSEQTSKQAQEPSILSLWQSLTDKKLMALVLACMGQVV